jgi:two-component system chemotaxis response regulator CheY
MATILIVDDAAFMRTRCARLLTENGHQVIEAGNGVEAVQKYQESRPDCVLLDITMPEMDGLTALQEIRKVDPNARVAMVTAMGQQSIILQAIKSGARDFVMKPFERDRVLAAVEKLLA